MRRPRTPARSTSDSAEVAGPGFVNLQVSDAFLAEALGEIGEDYGGSSAEPRERVQVIDKNAHVPTVFGRELARQAPAHANVAEIVDDGAKKVACDHAGTRCRIGDGTGC